MLSEVLLLYAGEINWRQVQSSPVLLGAGLRAFFRQTAVHRHQRERRSVLLMIAVQCVVPPATVGLLVLNDDRPQ